MLCFCGFIGFIALMLMPFKTECYLTLHHTIALLYDDDDPSSFFHHVKLYHSVILGKLVSELS